MQEAELDVGIIFLIGKINITAPEGLPTTFIKKLHVVCIANEKSHPASEY